MRVPQGRHRAIHIQDKRKCKRGVPDRDSIVIRLATRHFHAGLSLSMPSALLLYSHRHRFASDVVGMPDTGEMPQTTRVPQGRHRSLPVMKYNVPSLVGTRLSFVWPPGTSVPGFHIPCLRHCFYIPSGSAGTAPIQRLLSHQMQFRLFATLFQILFRRNVFDGAPPDVRCNVLPLRGWSC